MSRVITFFSYKGGVGRSMALANIGALLALGGKRVLLLDFDLEAPGLDLYFRRFAPNQSFDRGVLPLLLEASNSDSADWRQHVYKIAIHAENNPTAGEQTIALMPSGSDRSDYAEQLQNFTWKQFIKNCKGAEKLECWKEEWKKDYDFILVDSRTGITDTGGICTVLLPDFLVFVFNANNQSYHRGKEVLASIQAARLANEVPKPPLTVLPLLSRFEPKEEVDLVSKWLDDFSTGLKPYFDDWLPKPYNPRQMLEVTRIPHVPRFSFGENLPVLTHSLTEPGWPGHFYVNITRLLETDFREAAQVIDPNAPMPKDAATRVREVLAKSPIDEIEVNKALANAEIEIGSTLEFARLLNAAGLALKNHARFASAEPFYRRALNMDERLVGSTHLSVARDLNNLALLLLETNRVAEAETLMRRAQVIAEASFENDHPAVALSLSNLASLLKETNRLAEAEPLMRRALAIDEASFGNNHPNVATALNNLAQLLQATNRLTEAEPLMRRALAIDEGSFGKDHATVGIDLNNLAQLLAATNRLAEAEPLMRRALAIDEVSFGKDHPSVAIRLNNLAILFKDTNRVAEAEPLMRRALAIHEASFGNDHPKVAVALNNLAQLLQATNRLTEAEPLMRRALAIDEASFGNDHPKVAIRLNNLAQLLQDTNRLAEAEPLMRRALAIDEANFGADHPDVATDLNNLAHLLNTTNRLTDAEPLMRRHLEIFLKYTASTGHAHPNLEDGFQNYRRLLSTMGRDDDEISTTISALCAEYGVKIN